MLGEEERPHRAGTRENELVRVRLLGLLDQLGVQSWVLPMDVPQAVAERSKESIDQVRERVKIVAPMANIVAHIPGEKRSRPVVLASHYDSAYNAPGAGDAGQCVAGILETIRAIKAEPLRYETWILLTDAEEFGLWGAQALIEQNQFPWGDDKPVVINFDARGDRGAVLLYETHEDNFKAMQVAAGGIASPRFSTSLMVNVYRRLPNGTDFTIFRNAGWCGWNFAVVAGADRYHTEEDNLANLSSRSVQHFAAHAHSLLRRLDALPPEELQNLDQSQPATFFDVLGWFLIVYPASWNIWQLGLIIVLVCAGWTTSRAQIRLSRVALVGTAIVLLACVSYGIGWCMVRGLQAADMLPKNFVRHYELIILLFVVAAIACNFAAGRMLRAVCRRDEVIAGISLIYLILGFACCQWFAGGAYLILWPAMWLAIGWLISQRLSITARPWLPPLLWCLGPAILYSPTYVLLAQCLGPRAGPLIAVAVAVMLLPTWIDLTKD